MISEAAARAKAHRIADVLGYPATKRFLAIFRSEATRNAYRADLAQFEEFLRRGRVVLVTEPDWASVTRPQLVAFHAHLTERGAASSAARKWACLRSFFGWLLREGLIDHNPTEGLAFPPTETRAVSSVLTPEAVDRLLAQPTVARYADEKRRQREGLDPKPHPLLIRDDALLRLLYATGIRTSEAVDLHVYDYDGPKWEEAGNPNFPGGLIRVGHETRSREIDVDPRTALSLAMYLAKARPLLADGPGMLFVNHRREGLTRQGCWLILKTHAQAAGLTDVSPSSLRHARAAELLKSGSVEDAALLLGHANTYTTRALYGPWVGGQRPRVGA